MIKDSRTSRTCVCLKMFTLITRKLVSQLFVFSDSFGSSPSKDAAQMLPQLAIVVSGWVRM